MNLKLKYRVYNEPEKWKDNAGHKNMQKGKGKPGGTSGKRIIKPGMPHPVGFSGRTLALKRAH